MIRYHTELIIINTADKNKKLVLENEFPSKPVVKGVFSSVVRVMFVEARNMRSSLANLKISFAQWFYSICSIVSRQRIYAAQNRCSRISFNRAFYGRSSTSFTI